MTTETGSTKARVQLRGTAPLLMHNIRLANPLDPITKAIKAISGKRKKTEDDIEQMARLEFEGSLYYDPDVGVYIPGLNVEKCIVEGARVTRQGKQVERGVRVYTDMIPLIYDGPSELERLWAHPDFNSFMAVKVGTSRVMRTRPKFPEWGLEFEAVIDLGLLQRDQFVSIVTDAGTMVGLGDYRPRFGRFDARIEFL